MDRFRRPGNRRFRTHAGGRLVHYGHVHQVHFPKGVQFHHGWGELTAYDFEDAIRDALHDDNRGSRQYRPYIDNVEVLNDYEAVLNLKRVNVTLFRNISQFVPGFELMSGKNFNDVGEYPAFG